MRVIETVTTPSATTFTAETTPKTHLMAAPSVPPPSNASQHLISTFTAQNVLPLPTPAVANPVLLPNAPSAVPVMSTTLNTFTSVTPTGPPPVQSIATPKIMVPGIFEAIPIQFKNFHFKSFVLFSYYDCHD